jgi:hypothetical protein
MQLRVLTAVGAAVIGWIAFAGGAQAAPAFHCEASALRATLAGQQSVEPVTQGRDGPCATGAATPGVVLPGGLLDASALVARTGYDGAAGAGAATGGLTHLQVLPTPDLIAQAQAPIRQFVDQLPPQPVAIPLPVVGNLIELDVRQALQDLIPAPGAALLSVDQLTAHADVACQGGATVVSGWSEIAGVKLLGHDVGLDRALDQTLPLIDAKAIRLSELDLSKVTILGSAGQPLTQPVLDLVRPLLAAALATAPPIELPATLVHVQLTPNEQISTGSSLTQRALHASISLLGQPVLDAVLGEAEVSAADGACTPPAAVQAPAPPRPPAGKATTKPVAGRGSVADQILACTDRKLVLVDVLERGSRVKLLGAADRRYVGRKIAIRLRASGNVVAHAVVRKDGSFQTTAAMPPRAYLATNKRANSVRYRAEIGKELSLPLKLRRRLIVNRLSSKGGKVTISGRVVRPLTTPVSAIRLVRRVSCHKVVLVRRFKPRADGTFRVTVKAPKGQAAAVYRMATSVREKASNPRTYPTFTLPRGVALDTR